MKLWLRTPSCVAKSTPNLDARSIRKQRSGPEELIRSAVGAKTYQSELLPVTARFRRYKYYYYVAAMDVPEPEQTPFTAVTAHTSRLTRVSFSMRIGAWFYLESI